MLFDNPTENFIQHLVEGGEFGPPWDEPAFWVRAVAEDPLDAVENLFSAFGLLPGGDAMMPVVDVSVVGSEWWKSLDDAGVRQDVLYFCRRARLRIPTREQLAAWRRSFVLDPAERAERVSRAQQGSFRWRPEGYTPEQLLTPRRFRVRWPQDAASDIRAFAGLDQDRISALLGASRRVPPR